jgi:hypothetical protein
MSIEVATIMRRPEERWLAQSLAMMMSALLMLGLIACLGFDAASKSMLAQSRHLHAVNVLSSHAHVAAKHATAAR